MAKLYMDVVLREDGEEEVIGYAYGDEWVAQALAMGDIRFDTEEEAKAWWAWWEKNYG